MNEKDQKGERVSADSEQERMRMAAQALDTALASRAAQIRETHTEQVDQED